MNPQKPNSDTSYWDRPFEGAAEMAAKYTACLAALAQPQSDRNRALRAAASRWPGSLRECQLVDPRVYAAREAAAARAAEHAAAPRADWRARGDEAVCLWADLHDLLRDQRDAHRRREPGRRRPNARAAMIVLAGRADLDPSELALILFGRDGLWRHDGGR